MEKRTTKLSFTIFILVIMRAVSHRVLWMTRLLLAQAVSQRDPFLATEVGVSSISPVKLLGGPEPRFGGAITPSGVWLVFSSCQGCRLIVN